MPEGSECGSLSSWPGIRGLCRDPARNHACKAWGGGPESVLGMSDVWSFVRDNGLL